MSRPVIPALALAFLGWSTVAAAAPSAVDDKPAAGEDAPAAPVDALSKKKRKHAKKGKKERPGHARDGGPAGHPGPEHRVPQRDAHAPQADGHGHGHGHDADKPGRRRGHDADMPGRRRGHHEHDEGADAPDDDRDNGGEPMARGSAGQAGARVGRAPRGDAGTRRAPAGPRQGGEAPARTGKDPSSREPVERPDAQAGSSSSQRPAPAVGRAPQAGGARGDKGGIREGNKARDGKPGKKKGRKGAKAGKRNVRVKHAPYLPERWVPDYHRKGLSPSDPRYWASGIFLYNPPKGAHRVTMVEQNPGGTQTVHQAPKPTRAVDRRNSFSIGLRGGSYMGEGISGIRDGDLGLGVAARYRPIEALGVEVAWARHANDWQQPTGDVSNPLQVSGQVFAFPWTRVSPFLSAGYTWTTRSSVGPQGNLQTDRVKGPHGGLGLELALGQSAALDLEGRYIHYGDLQQVSLEKNGALQGTLGLNFYF